MQSRFSSDHFSSIPVKFCVDLEQPWPYRSLSASLLLVFSENPSTWRCIFDVSMGGNEFCILLLPPS